MNLPKSCFKTVRIHAIYASHLRMCLWKGFQNCPEAPQHCLPHLKHPIQLVRSLVETKTWSESENMSFIIMGSCEDCSLSSLMLKLIALSYTVMLNGYSQLLNIKPKKNYFIETSVVSISVMLAFNRKKDAIKNILSLCCLYIVHLKIECEIIPI